MPFKDRRVAELAAYQVDYDIKKRFRSTLTTGNHSLKLIVSKATPRECQGYHRDPLCTKLFNSLWLFPSFYNKRVPQLLILQIISGNIEGVYFPYSMNMTYT